MPVQSRRRTPVPKAVELSVIVPTRNEAGNVLRLVAALREALLGIESEVIFVDDSDDETPKLISNLEVTEGVTVRLLHRLPQKRSGLGSAVLEGMELANGELVAVMDGDMQHPPSMLPGMAARLRGENLDMVVASRYVGGGSSEGLSGMGRQAVSFGSKWLAQVLFKEARKTSDPLTGFFVVRMKTLDGIAFRPHGFKVLLEILVCAWWLKVGDVPFVMGKRHSGRSNASVAEGMAYLRHLSSLFTQVPGAARPWKFAAVGGAGLAVYAGLLAFLSPLFGPFPAWGAAYLCSLVLNWKLNGIFTFADVSSPFSPGRAGRHYLPVALAGGGLNLLAFTFLLAYAPPVSAGLGGAFVATCANYAFLRQVIQRPAAPVPSAEGLGQVLKAIAKELPGSEVALLGADETHGLPALLGAVTKPLILAEAPSSKRQPRRDARLRSWMLLPLPSNVSPGGTIIASRQGKAYGADELDSALSILGTFSENRAHGGGGR